MKHIVHDEAASPSAGSETTALWTHGDRFGAWELDSGGDSLLLSAASARLHGLPCSEDGGTSTAVLVSELSERIAPEDRAAFLAMLQNVASQPRQNGVGYRVRVSDSDQEWRWIRSYGQRVSEPIEASSRMVGIHVDASREVDAVQAVQTRENIVRLNQERLRHAFNAGKDGIFDVDIRLGSCIVSPSWAARLGYANPPPTVEFWESLIHSEDKETYLEKKRQFLEEGLDSSENEHRQRCADGSYIWVLMRVKSVGPETVGYPFRIIGTLVDMTERKQSEFHFTYLAEHDALTGLPNRHLFGKRLDEITREPLGDCVLAAVLICNLDRFKAVNDTCGHHIGDAVLREAARRIASAPRTPTFVARLGGDEFALIVPDGRGDEIGEVCRSIIASMSESIVLDGRVLNVGISVGAASARLNGRPTPDVFKNAGVALASAKSKGRNTFAVYDAAVHRAIEDRSALAADLREALRRDEFHIWYQPVIHAVTSEITSVEALLYWNHPARGMLPPGEFVPIAESTGLIVPLGNWALAKACREAMNWPADVKVAVNVSAAQFDASFRETVLVALVKAGLPAERLKLEVAESAFVDDPEAKLALLETLRELGIRVALDEFGKGFCSLSYLRRYPFDKIKIDRTFTRDIGEADAAAIVSAVVDIGRRLKIGIVAEGVDTSEQFDLVRGEGCEEVQGTFLCAPLPSGEMAAVFTSRPRSAEP